MDIGRVHESPSIPDPNFTRYRKLLLLGLFRISMNISTPMFNLKHVKRPARDAVIPILTTLAILGLIFIQSSRGFDFSDEGLYILALDSSRLNQVFNTPFHLPLRFVWFGSGENVFTYRLISALILLAVCWVWAWHTLLLFTTEAMSDMRLQWASLIVALTFIPFYGLGLPTPAYNFLTYLGSLLVTAGVFRLIYLSKSTNLKWGIGPAGLISVGLAVSMFGKFSVPIILAGASLLVIFSTVRMEILNKVRFVIIALSMFLGTVLGLSSPLNVVELGNLFSTGIQNVITMDSTYSPLDSIETFFRTAIIPVSLAITLFVAFFLVLPRIFPMSSSNVQSVFLIFTLALGFATTSSPNTWRFATLVIVFVFAVLFSYKFFREVDLWPPFVFVCVASVAPAIGGNNGFELVGMYLGPLIAISAALLSREWLGGEGRLRVTFSLVMVLVSIAITAVESPYRQLSLRAQTESIPVATGTLMLDPARSRTVMELRNCLGDNDLGGAVGLDFTTNFSAGLIYLLGLKTPDNILGTIWLYDGAEILMQKSVDRLSPNQVQIALLTQSVSESERLASARRLFEDRGASVVPVCSSGEWQISKIKIKESSE